MTINLLECMQLFVQVVEREGFSRAASAMQISPAKVSTQIQSLEGHLGVQLLSRTTRSVSLTEDGRSYYEHCKRVLADISGTEAMLSQSKGLPRGRLHIDVSVTLATRLILPVLAEFQRRFPAIELELLHTGHLFDMQQDGLDVMLRLGPLEDTSLIARPLGSTELITVASPEYLTRYGIPETPQDVLNHRCISYVDSITGRPRPWVFSRDSDSISIVPRAGLAFNQGESRLAAAVLGLGVYQGLDIGLERLLLDGALKPVLEDWKAPGPQIYVAYAHHGYLSSRIRAFVDFLLECYPSGKPIKVPASFKTDPSLIVVGDNGQPSAAPLRAV